jgi:transketolase
MNYEEKLIELALNNPDIRILTAENRASIRNLPDVVGKQFIDTGINEQTLVGVSAGLALRGRIPIVHAIAAFLTMRSFEFVRTDIGYPNLNVKLVGNFGGFLSTANGPTHQAVEDISLMRSIPNMNILCPADIDDLVKSLPKAVNYKKPFYIRYNDLPAVVEHSEFALGQAEVFGESGEVSIIVYGTLFGEVYKAKQILESEGIGVRVINLRTLVPIDREVLVKTFHNSRTIFAIEDHFYTGGLNSILSEIIVEERLTVDLKSISLESRFFKPLGFNQILEYEGFSAGKIAEKIKNHLNIKERVYNVEWSNG